MTVSAGKKSSLTQSDFGSVTDYDSEKGFGFIEGHFSGIEVFFHINTIKKIDPELAKKIDSEAYELGNDLDSPDSMCFWYEFGRSTKGPRVERLISTRSKRNKAVTNLLEEELSKPVYVPRRLIDESEKFIENSKLEELIELNKCLINEKNYTYIETSRNNIELLKKEQVRRLEASKLPFANLSDVDIALKIQELTEKIELLDGTAERNRLAAEDEFRSLLEEIKPFAFETSSELSKYIVENRLGEKYKHITGVATMAKGDETWRFEGAVLEPYYRRLCNALYLNDKNSGARIKEFELYSESAFEKNNHI